MQNKGGRTSLHTGKQFSHTFYDTHVAVKSFCLHQSISPTLLLARFIQNSVKPQGFDSKRSLRGDPWNIDILDMGFIFQKMRINIDFKKGKRKIEYNINFLNFLSLVKYFEIQIMVEGNIKYCITKLHHIHL